MDKTVIVYLKKSASQLNYFKFYIFKRQNAQNAAEFSLNVTLQFTVIPNSIQDQQFISMYASNNRTIAQSVPLGFSCLIDPLVIQITSKNFFINRNNQFYGTNERKLFLKLIYNDTGSN